MPNNEWKEITDPEELFKLKRKEWEIEYFDSFHTCWVIWNRVAWNEKWKFRARPHQPKMEKVKLLAYLDLQGEFRRIREKSFTNSNWTRVPSEDKEIEVPE